MHIVFPLTYVSCIHQLVCVIIDVCLSLPGFNPRRPVGKDKEPALPENELSTAVAPAQAVALATASTSLPSNSETMPPIPQPSPTPDGPLSGALPMAKILSRIPPQLIPCHLVQSANMPATSIVRNNSVNDSSTFRIPRLLPAGKAIANLYLKKKRKEAVPPLGDKNKRPTAKILKRKQKVEEKEKKRKSSKLKKDSKNGEIAGTTAFENMLSPVVEQENVEQV